MTGLNPGRRFLAGLWHPSIVAIDGCHEQFQLFAGPIPKSGIGFYDYVQEIDLRGRPHW